MGLKDFVIGDRVILLENGTDFDENGYMKPGITGTVVGVEGSMFLNVDWDDFVDGHNCGGKAKVGYGWSVPYYCVKLYATKQYEVASISDIDNLLFG